MSRADAVIFLQNAWFPEGTRASAIKRYASDLAFRRRVLAESATGRRLLAAFGERWYNRIHWDNATPVAGIGSSDISLPADLDHMSKVISECRPRVIGTMGGTAERGVEALIEQLKIRNIDRIKIYNSPHPNARGTTSGQLRDFAISIIENFEPA